MVDQGEGENSTDIKTAHHPPMGYRLPPFQFCNAVYGRFSTKQGRHGKFRKGSMMVMVEKTNGLVQV